jgi:hypothetical protein
MAARISKITTAASSVSQNVAPAASAATSPVPELPAGVGVDGRSRRIRVRKLDALARIDFADVLGPERIQNPSVSGPAAVAFSVIEIAGEAVDQPNSWSEMRMLIKRLDDDGIACAASTLVRSGYIELPPEEGSDPTGER